ncbi:hypothetical protein ACX0G7_24760 [Flavitalea antarctica]
MLTARDLLYKALDYDCFWSAGTGIKDSLPAQSRRLQLEQLFKGFGIIKNNVRSESQTPYQNDKDHTAIDFYSSSKNNKPLKRIQYIKKLTDFQYFREGEFLADMDEGKYEKLKGQIVSNINTVYPDKLEINTKGEVNLVRLFADLYNFRIHFHMFTYSVTHKASPSFSIAEDYGLNLRMNAVQSMTVNLSAVDELLCLLIDVEKREFNESDINYPDPDLKQIDEEWQRTLVAPSSPRAPA